MTFCQNCGSELDASASFCGSCGNASAARARPSAAAIMAADNSVASPSSANGEATANSSARANSASAHADRPMGSSAPNGSAYPTGRDEQRNGVMPVPPALSGSAPGTTSSTGPTKTPRNSNTTNFRRNIVLIAAGLALMVAVGGFVFHQQTALADARAQSASLKDELASSKARASDLQDQLSTSDGRVADLTGQVSGLNVQLSACERNITYSIRMDKALNDKVSNVLFNGSLSQFFRIIDNYDAAGELWVTSARECNPGGNYSFK